VLIAAWQLQTAVPPHWHAGMSPSELLEHAEHRHFHWPHEAPAHSSGGHLHSAGIALDHEGCRRDRLASVPCDHDHDAVYVEAVVAGQVDAESPHEPPQCGGFPDGALETTVHSLEEHVAARPRYGGAVPTFLATTRLLL
jgi:hypothetical protein